MGKSAIKNQAIPKDMGLVFSFFAHLKAVNMRVEIKSRPNKIRLSYQGVMISISGSALKLVGRIKFPR